MTKRYTPIGGCSNVHTTRYAYRLLSFHLGAEHVRMNHERSIAVTSDVIKTARLMLDSFRMGYEIGKRDERHDIKESL